MATKLSEAQVRILTGRLTEYRTFSADRTHLLVDSAFDRKACAGLAKRNPALLKQYWTGGIRNSYELTPEGEKVRAELLAAQLPKSEPKPFKFTVGDIVTDGINEYEILEHSGIDPDDPEVTCMIDGGSDQTYELRESELALVSDTKAPAQPPADTPPAAPSEAELTREIVEYVKQQVAQPPYAPRWGKPLRMRDSDLLYDATDIAELKAQLDAAIQERDALRRKLEGVVSGTESLLDALDDLFLPPNADRFPPYTQEYAADIQRQKARELIEATKGASDV